MKIRFIESQVVPREGTEKQTDIHDEANINFFAISRTNLKKRLIICKKNINKALDNFRNILFVK